MGSTGSLRTVRRYVGSLEIVRSSKRRTVRFETAPVKQAQADWAHCGPFPDATGKMVPIYAFFIVLGLLANDVRAGTIARISRIPSLIWPDRSGLQCQPRMTWKTLSRGPGVVW